MKVRFRDVLGLGAGAGRVQGATLKDIGVWELQGVVQGQQ